ncbi:MAG: PKD domain-containing protein [Candidatus Aenigmarchaeota archaeon]|nr:PKD domain-containing protein [Candidatus Aenigmarchaeota archaeon]
MGSMKGGMLEWVIGPPLLVFIGIFILSMIGAAYVRTLAAGPPIEVQTYAEYRWMNILPSSALSVLTANEYSQEALEALALCKEVTTPLILPRARFIEYFSGNDEINAASLGALDRQLQVLESSYNRGSEVKREFKMIKDSQGLVLVYGLDRMLSDAESGYGSLVTVYPEDYPYKCSQMGLPVFSNEEENARVSVVVCCLDIRGCSDYFATPGRDECSPKDPCGVGPCRIIQPVGEERACVFNAPPKVTFAMRILGDTAWREGEKFSLEFAKGTEKTVEFQATALEDSSVKFITLDYGDSVPESRTGNTPPAAGTPISPETYSFSHTYQNPGTYTAKLRIEDDGGNVVVRDMELEIDSI